MVGVSKVMLGGNSWTERFGLKAYSISVKVAVPKALTAATESYSKSYCPAGRNAEKLA
jgi:hypothetical protein